MAKHAGKIIRKFRKYKVVDCNVCKFIHIFPIPSDKELFSLYNNDYYQKTKPDYIQGNEKEMNYLNNTFDEKLGTVEKFLPSKSKRILDIGSGPGFFLRRAKRRGWNVLGIEPSSIASNYAKKYNIPTIQKFFHQVNIKQIGKFDVIHIFTLSSDSKNSGNIDHINYFDFSTISDVLTRIGFKIILKESTFPLELFLLMGYDYIKNPKIGKKKHLERIQFEKNFENRNARKVKRTLYQKFAEIGIGRTAIIYAKK